LFVEELTKAVLESEASREQAEFAGVLTERAVPETLNDLLMARLDRQGAAKEIAQIGAVLGREFYYRWLQSVCPYEENTLQQELAQLVASGLLFKRGMAQEAFYVFKHALIRDAAYASLLKKTRKYYHGRIAQVFVENFPEIAESRPEVLAHHYTEAENKKDAVDFWRRAGFHALQRSACVEAAAHLSRGLAILKTMPNTQKRPQLELEMLTARGPAIIYTKGFGAREVKQNYARARKLCRQAGETAQLFPALFGAGVFCSAQADYLTARELREQLLRIAEQADDPALIIEACWMEGATRYYLAEFEQAKALLERGIALYDPQKHHALAMQFTGSDPCVNLLTYMTFTFWFLGFPEKARACLRSALKLSNELSHPMSRLFALNTVNWLHSLSGEVEAVLEGAPKAIALAAELLSGSFVALGTIFQGWATAKIDQEKQGIIALHQGLTQCHDTGLESGRTFFLGLLADACQTKGDVAEGLRAIAEALAMAKKTGERMYEAELFRLKGVLLLQQHQAESKVEPWFFRALQISPQQGGEITGAPLRHEPGAIVAKTEQVPASPPVTAAGLRLVHRRLRYT
jgi:predicted ATPase